VRKTAIKKLAHGTHPLLGNGKGKHSMSQERRGGYHPLQREERRASRALEMRLFGEADPPNPATEKARCHTPCLPKVPKGRARRSRATTREWIPRQHRGRKDTAISRHITTYRQDRRYPGRKLDWESEDP
jgi:hypothetical protein